MPINDMDTIGDDVIIPDRPGNGGGTVTDTGDAGKNDGEPQVWPGEASDVDGADIVAPALGWSPFAAIGGVGLNLPNFTFSGSSGGALKPAGVLLIIAALAGVGYYLYKRYKK